MKKFPNGAVNLILAATIAPVFASAATFAQTPNAELPALALPGSSETLVAETVADVANVEFEYADAVISPDEALRQLIAGNARYLKGASDAANALPRPSTAADRFPIATILYASDMPVKPDALTQTTDRDVYLTPIQSGAVASDDLAAVEYGVLNLRTPLLLVVGHYPSRDVSNLVRNFDALEKRAQAEASKISADQRLATDASVPDDLKTYNLVGPAVARAREAYPDLQGYELANVVSEALVWQSLETILLKSTVVQDLVRAGRLDVVAALADDKTGRLHWLGQHPLQEEFVKPLPEEYVLAESAETADGTAILSADDLPAPLDADAIQVYVERYENNAYYADYVDEYYRVPIYYEPSWELFDARAWTYRPWSGVWVDSFVPWPHYHPWGPPPGVAPEFGFSYFNGHLNFFIGVNRRPDGPRYVDPRFRPRDAWWAADVFIDPRRFPRDPIFDLIFGGRRRDVKPLPFDKRPGYRPGPPRPHAPAPRVPGWRPGDVRPGFDVRPGRPGPGGLTPIPAPRPGVDRPGFDVRPGRPGGFDVRPGYRPGVDRPGVDMRPENRPGAERPQVGNRPGAERPQIGDRPGVERPQIGNRPGAERPQIGDRPGVERPQIGNRPGAERPQIGNRPGAERPQVGNRPGAERPQVGNRPGAERPQIGDRPGVERPQVGNRPGVERPQIGNRPGAERPKSGTDPEPSVPKSETDPLSTRLAPAAVVPTIAPEPR